LTQLPTAGSPKVTYIKVKMGKKIGETSGDPVT